MCRISQEWGPHWWNLREIKGGTPFMVGPHILVSWWSWKNWKFSKKKEELRFGKMVLTCKFGNKNQERERKLETLQGDLISQSCKWRSMTKMERESNKQAKKESKHALDVQHGSHTPHCMPNMEVPLIAPLFPDFSRAASWNDHNSQTVHWIYATHLPLESSFRVDIRGA